MQVSIILVQPPVYELSMLSFSWQQQVLWLRMVQAEAERKRLLKRLREARAAATQPHQPRWFTLHPQVCLKEHAARWPRTILLHEVNMTCPHCGVVHPVADRWQGKRLVLHPT